jgi:hypothetical protein
MHKGDPVWYGMPRLKSAVDTVRSWRAQLERADEELRMLLLHIQFLCTPGGVVDLFRGASFTEKVEWGDSDWFEFKDVSSLNRACPICHESLERLEMGSGGVFLRGTDLCICDNCVVLAPGLYPALQALRSRQAPSWKWTGEDVRPIQDDEDDG